MQIVKVMYHDDELEKIQKISEGDLIDLRAAETVTFQKGELKFISLGVSMQLPDGYFAKLYARSSTPLKHKIILANGVGIIDSQFCGSQDVWKFLGYAIEDTVIHKGDRIAQFEVVKKGVPLFFKTVDNLDTNPNRGGFGSTGVK